MSNNTLFGILLDEKTILKGNTSAESFNKIKPLLINYAIVIRYIPLKYFHEIWERFVFVLLDVVKMLDNLNKYLFLSEWIR